MNILWNFRVCISVPLKKLKIEYNYTKIMEGAF